MCTCQIWKRRTWLVSDWMNYLVSIVNSTDEKIITLYTQKNSWIATSFTISALFAAIIFPYLIYVHADAKYIFFMGFFLIILTSVSIERSVNWHSKLIKQNVEFKDAFQNIIASIIEETLKDSDSIRDVYNFTVNELAKKSNKIIKEMKLK